MPIAPVDQFELAGLQPAIYANEAKQIAVRIQPSLVNLPKGTVLGETTLSQDSVHTLAANGASAGTFTLSFRGYTTTVLNFNDSTATVQAALRALPSIGALGVVCGGTAVNGAGMTITWSGTVLNFAKNPVELPTITLVTAFVGATLTIVSTTVGSQLGYYGPYVSGGSNGLGTAKVISKYKMSTDAAGNITFAETASGEQFGQTRLTAPVYISGTFKIEDLPLTTITGITGGFLDTTALTGLGGRILQGSIAGGTGLFRIG